MDDTPNLALPYIMAAQAQKHVTHNEAIRAMDALVQLTVLDRDLSAPPASPADGARYIVGAGPTGAWAGAAGNIAAWQDGAWAFYLPLEGWLAWVADEDVLLSFDGAGWSPALSLQNVPLLGINATADTTNRLALSSAASLFNHAGAGHQVKVNKAAAGDTASFLFQTGFSGRAELGTTGDDKLHFKVSPDGMAFTDAFVIDPATGFVGVGTDAPGEALAVGYGANGNISLGSATDNKSYLGSFNDNVVFAINRRVSDGNFANTGLPTASFGFFTSSGNSEVRFGTANANNVADTPRLKITNVGDTAPAADNAYSCGYSGFRWSAVWAANGTIQTSDARDKDVTGRLGFAGALVDAVDPVLFRWKVGGNEAVAGAEPKPRPGKRTHAGFLAQDLKAAMDAANADFAAWGLDDAADPASRQWTRPDQLVAVLWAALQQTRARVAALENAVYRTAP